jgi:deoxyribonuclease IV
MKFGAHMSTSGGVWKALERGASIGCEAVQIFVKNNMQWFGKLHAPSDCERFSEELARKKLSLVFGHTGYLINLAAPDGANRENSLKSLIQEIEIATQLCIPFLVMHPGAHLGAGEKVGIKRVADGLNTVFSATKKSPVRIALENTAGQGSCLGWKNEHLAAIYDSINKPERVGICLDTAHFFAAGYDIRAPRGWDDAINELEDLVGLKEILAFHLNDSKTDLGSHVDRHEHIGKGKIGKNGFHHIVNDARFKHHHGCIETPKSEDLHEDVENLKTLRSLRKKR